MQQQMSFLYKNSTIYLQKNSCEVGKEKYCYIFEMEIFLYAEG